MIQIDNTSVNVGCDPEFFFKDIDRGGMVIGAECIIPRDGLDGLYPMTMPHDYAGKVAVPKAFIIDGVQAELNPGSNPCRANLSNHISYCFATLRDHLKSMPSIKCCFDCTVDVDLKELENLSDKAKVFGCAPSKNIYDPNATVEADPRKYPKRSAGGHIHVGITGHPIWATETLRYRDYTSGKDLTVEKCDHRLRLIPFMDILVGLPSVLIDRDPNAVERRKNYGRAGEYRLPKHGIEYRTLSNYWLKSYPLFSFVMGMTRLAHGALSRTLEGEFAAKNGKLTPTGYGTAKLDAKTLEAYNLEKELFTQLDPRDVAKVINNNDLEGAKQMWPIVEGFLTRHTGDYATGLTRTTMSAFNHFCKMTQEKGLEYWFPENPVDHWADKPEGHGSGWESFIQTKVVEDMHRRK